MDFGFLLVTLKKWIWISDFACNLKKVDFGFSACDSPNGQMDLKMDLKMDRILLLVKKKRLCR